MDDHGFVNLDMQSNGKEFFINDGIVNKNERDWMADFSSCDGTGNCKFVLPNGVLTLNKFGEISIKRNQGDSVEVNNNLERVHIQSKWGQLGYDNGHLLMKSTAGFHRA